MSQLELLPAPPPLTRAEALVRLAALRGRDLRPLADSFGVTVWIDGRRNKGWAGHTVERYLGRRPDSLQAPDFGDWELKVVPLVAGADGQWRLKETMAITAFTPAELEVTEFEDSHLLEKLGHLIVVARSAPALCACTSMSASCLRTLPFSVLGLCGVSGRSGPAPVSYR